MTSRPPTTTDHAELLRRWSAGDQQALSALLEAHVDWIRATVRRRLGGELRTKEESTDVMQDAALEFLRYGPRFAVRTENEFRAILARIVENVIRDHHHWFARRRRDMHRERPLPSDTTVALDPDARRQSPPNEEAARREEEAMLRLALELMPPLCRRVLLLHGEDGKTFAEVGTEVGLSEEAARKRYRRALARLSQKVRALRAGQFGEV